MHRSIIRLVFLVILSSFVAAAPSTQPVSSGPAWNGGIKIVNYLDIGLYVRSVFVKDGPVHTIDGNGGHYSEIWRPSHNDTGVSIKISTKDGANDVLQFEYTAKNQLVYWDLSCINLSRGSRFFEDGFVAIPTSLECPPALCWPDGRLCSDVYFKPDDNFAVRGCEANSWVVLKIGRR